MNLRTLFGSAIRPNLPNTQRRSNRLSRKAGRLLAIAHVRAFVLVLLLVPLVACDQGLSGPPAISTSPAIARLSSPTTHSAASATATAYRVATNTAVVTPTAPTLPPRLPTSTPADTITIAETVTVTGEGAIHAVPAPTISSGLTYVFPVQPISSVTYGPYHHDYPATDIFCPAGSRFVAPTSGVVDYVSTVDRWDPSTDDPAARGGLSVAIIGDDGVRYYGSHLSRVWDGIVPGVRVAAGRLLGLTGKTGDARFTDSHLHFGISPPTTPDDWKVRRGAVSPYNYLRAWAAGTQLRPVLK